MCFSRPPLSQATLVTSWRGSSGSTCAWESGAVLASLVDTRYIAVLVILIAMLTTTITTTRHEVGKQCVTKVQMIENAHDITVEDVDKVRLLSNETHKASRRPSPRQKTFKKCSVKRLNSDAIPRPELKEPKKGLSSIPRPIPPSHSPPGVGKCVCPGEYSMF